MPTVTAGSSGPTYGNAISVDTGDGTTVGTVATLGVEAYDNWQYFVAEDATLTNAEDDTGTATTCDITTSNTGGSRTSSNSGAGNEYDMLERGIDAAWYSGGTDIAISQIPFSKYDIILYFSEHSFSNSGNTADIGDGTTTYVYDVAASANYTGTWEQLTETGAGGGAGNYARWDGLTASSVTLNATSSGFGGVIICGLQIIERTD